MRKFYLLSAIFVTLFSHNPTWGQNARFLTRGGSGANDEATKILQLAGGITYMAGYYNQLSSFGTQTISYAGADDAFISKLDASGNYLWTSTVSGAGSDKIAGIAEASNGDIILAGHYTNSTILGNLSISGPGQNIFVARLNASNGNPIWFRSYGGSGIENCSGLTVLPDGSICITGQFQGSTSIGSFSFTSQNFYNSGQPGYDVYLAKLNDLGNVISAVRLNSPDNDLSTGLDTDSDGNLYVSLLSGGAQLNSSNGANINLSNQYCGVLIKTNAALQIQLSRILNSGFIDIRALDVYGDKIALAGDFANTLTSPDMGMNALLAGFEHAVFVICLDLNGNFLSKFQEGSDNPLSINAVSINSQGNIWAGGKFSCRLNTLSDRYGESFFNSLRYDDIFIAYYQASLSDSLIYAQQMGSRGNDNLHDLSAGAFAIPAIAGSFEHKLIARKPVTCSNCGISTGFAGTYCSLNGYNQFNSISSLGSKDVFCANNIDTTQSPLNAFINPGCDFEIPPPRLSTNQDTIRTCSEFTLNSSLSLQAAVNSSSFFGDLFYDYEWRRNGSIFSTSSEPIATQTGLYTVKYYTADGCRTYFDTVFVEVLENIEDPVLWVNGAQFYPTINSFGYCNLQIPKHVDSTIVVSGTYYSDLENYSWIRNTPPVPVEVASDTSQVALTLGGNYSYNVTSEGGCSGSSCFNIWNYVPFTYNGVNTIPLSGNPPPVNGELVLQLADWPNDTIEVCKYQNTNPLVSIELLYEVGNQVYNLSIPAFADWDISGPTVIYPNYQNLVNGQPITHSFLNHYMSFRMSASGPVHVEFHLLAPWQNVDTLITITHDFYVIVNQADVASSQFSSSTDDLCPGDTLELSFSVSGGYPFSVINNNGFILPGTNTYGFAFPGSLTVNIAGIDPNGCNVLNSQTFNVVYKTAPPIFSNPANARKCPEDSVLLSAVDGLSVEWIGPEGTSIGEEDFIYVVAPGEYYYNLIDYDGCSLLSSTKEVRNIQAVIYDSIITTNLCGGQAALVLLAPDTNLQYQWFPPLFGNDTIKYITQPGNYAVQVALCSNVDTLRFSVYQGLQNTGLTVLSNPPFLCEGSQIELTANNQANEYLWFPGTQTSQNILVTEQGYYRVQVADTFGCVLTDSIFVQQYPNPPPPNGISTPDACPGTAITMSVNSFHQFNWFSLPDSTFLDSGNQFTTEIQENGQSFGGYVMNQNTGCISAWISTEAVLLTTTNIAPFPEEILYCPGDTVIFEPDEASGIAGGYWVGPNQFMLNQEDLFIGDVSLSQQGIYTYAALSAPGFCTYDTARVLVHPRFLDLSPVSYQDTLCRNETLVFSTLEQTGYTYSWTGPPALSFGGSDWSYPGVTPENTGLYLLTSRDGNCVRTDTFLVFVSEIPPQTPTIEAITHICDGDTLYLFNADSLSTNNAVVTWGGSDLFQFISPNAVFIPDFQSDNLANYTLQYGINQCLSAVSSFSPQFIELPVFAFGKDTVEFCEGEPIQLNSPQESPYYQWNTGSQQSSVTVYESGDLILTLIDALGCHYSDTVYVHALNCDLDDTPNAFSPNGDGFNDVLNFKVSGGLLYHAQIYDRWGKNIKAFEGAQEYSWDGTNEQGERVDDGTYFYLLLVKMVNGEVKDIQGTVTVLR